MLIRVFSSIRQKPKHVRDQYAFWIAVTVTALVATPWLLDVPSKLNSEQTTNEAEPVFSSFFNEAGSRLGDVTESFDGLRTPAGQSDTDGASSTATSTLLEVDFIAATTTPTTTSTTNTNPAQREVRIATTSNVSAIE